MNRWMEAKWPLFFIQFLSNEFSFETNRVHIDDLKEEDEMIKSSKNLISLTYRMHTRIRNKIQIYNNSIEKKKKIKTKQIN